MAPAMWSARSGAFRDEMAESLGFKKMYFDGGSSFLPYMSSYEPVASFKTFYSRDR